MFTAQSGSSHTFMLTERRPRRTLISSMIRLRPWLVAATIIVIILLSTIPYAPWLGAGAVVVYGGYTIIKEYLCKREGFQWYYKSAWAQCARAGLLIAALSIWLSVLYSTTDYLVQTRGTDTLWLLYVITVVVTCRTSRTEQMTGMVIFATLCLMGVTVCGYRAAGLGMDTVRVLALVTKILWLGLFSFVMHVFMRFLSDLYADVRLIGKVQQSLYQLVEATTDTPSASDDIMMLDNAVRQIASDFSYEHVNVFLRRSDGTLECVAGACEAGRKLASSGFALPGRSIISHVAETGVPHTSNDVKRDPYYLPHEAFPKTQAELAVPIRVGGETLGVLDAQTHRKNVFLEQDQEVMEILAGHLADAITYVRMHQSRFRINEIVQSITARFLSQHELTGTLEEIARAAHEVLGADVVVLFEYDSSAKRLTGPVFAGTPLQPEFLGNTMTEPDGLVNRILWGECDYYFHEDIRLAENSELFKATRFHARTGSPTFLERESVKARAIIRLQANKTRVGVMFLNFRSSRKFRDHEKKMYFTFANLAALAIHKGQFHQKQLQIEREEIARSLHDHLMGHIYGISQHLLAISRGPGLPSQALHDLEITQDAVQELRKDARYLHGMLRDKQSGDFAEEIRKVVSRVQNAYQIRCDLHWSGSSNRVAVPQATDLILILNEALLNSVRHGEPDFITIRLLASERDITMQVEDNGRGFDSRDSGNSSGIANMRDRANRMGGRFDISSTVGKGTCVTVNLPI